MEELEIYIEMIQPGHQMRITEIAFIMNYAVILSGMFLMMMRIVDLTWGLVIMFAPAIGSIFYIFVLTVKTLKSVVAKPCLELHALIKNYRIFLGYMLVERFELITGMLKDTFEEKEEMLKELKKEIETLEDTQLERTEEKFELELLEKKKEWLILEKKFGYVYHIFLENSFELVLWTPAFWAECFQPQEDEVPLRRLTISASVSLLMFQVLETDSENKRIYGMLLHSDLKRMPNVEIKSKDIDFKKMFEEVQRRNLKLEIENLNLKSEKKIYTNMIEDQRKGLDQMLNEQGKMFISSGLTTSSKRSDRVKIKTREHIAENWWKYLLSIIIFIAILFVILFFLFGGKLW